MKTNPNQEENPDSDYGIPHASGNGFNNSKAECSGSCCHFFHYIIKTKKGSVVCGFRKHF